MITFGPATSEASVLAMVRRKCKVLPTSPDAYTSDNIICAYANEEMQLLASECRSIKVSNTGSEPLTVQGQRTYDLPNDCLELVDVYLGPANAQIRMQQASTEYLYSNFGPGFMNRQGQPFYYYIDWDNQTNRFSVAFAMVPSVSNQLITMFYIQRPNPFVTASITISSLTQLTGTATAVCTNNFYQGQYVTISGANQSGYNIYAKVLNPTATQFQYAVNSGTVSPGTGTPVVQPTTTPQMDERLDNALIYAIAARIMHDKRDTAFSAVYDGKRAEYIAKYNDSGRKSREPLPALNNNRSDLSYFIGD